MRFAIKNKIVILSLLLFTNLSFVSQEETSACRSLFTAGRAEIHKKVFKNKSAFIKNYQGQEGYLRFTKELSLIHNMKDVFLIVSQILTKKEQKDLNWKQMDGTKQTLEKGKTQLLNKKTGRPKKDFISYKKAQKLMIELGIVTVKQFEKWSRSEKRPSDFPSNPHKTYNTKWKGWGEFLGTGNKPRQKFYKP